MTEINFKDFKSQILALRQNVWEQTDQSHMNQIFVNGFYDEHDDTASHWGIFDNNQILVASARLSIHVSVYKLPDHHLLKDISGLNIKFPVGSFNRLCVDKQFQGQGLSDLFDKVRIAKAIEKECNSVCGMTYGLRVLKLRYDGFDIFPVLTLSDNFITDKEKAKQLPPAFYYKILNRK